MSEKLYRLRGECPPLNPHPDGPLRGRSQGKEFNKLNFEAGSARLHGWPRRFRARIGALDGFEPLLTGCGVLALRLPSARPDSLEPDRIAQHGVVGRAAVHIEYVAAVGVPETHRGHRVSQRIRTARPGPRQSCAPLRGRPRAPRLAGAQSGWWRTARARSPGRCHPRPPRPHAGGRHA